MLQKIIQVGNSLAVTIPSSFAKQAGWSVGKQVIVTEEIDLDTLTIQLYDKKPLKGTLTPEFFRWLTKFNRRYKGALLELSKIH